MRTVVAVDLAAKFSACVVLRPDRSVSEQWDSGEMTVRQIPLAIGDSWERNPGCIVVIEDLPQHLPNSSIIKTVCQLQGRILSTLPHHALEDVYFVPPALWMRPMGVWCKDVDYQADIASTELGYSPPDLVEERGLTPGTRGQTTRVTEARKQMTDYVAARLIAEWALRAQESNHVWDSKLIRQYRS